MGLEDFVKKGNKQHDALDRFVAQYPGAPLYYPLLLAARLGIHDTERYLQPMMAPGKILRGLEHRASSTPISDECRNSFGFIDLNAPGKGERYAGPIVIDFNSPWMKDLLMFIEPKTTFRALKDIASYKSKLEDSVMATLDHLPSIWGERNVSDALENMALLMNPSISLLKKISCDYDVVHTLKGLDRFTRSVIENPRFNLDKYQKDRYLEAMGFLRLNFSTPIVEFLISNLHNKVSRAKILAEVDDSLALTYLGFCRGSVSPGLRERLGMNRFPIECFGEDNFVKMQKGHYVSPFWEADDKVFGSILGNIRRYPKTSAKTADQVSTATPEKRKADYYAQILDSSTHSRESLFSPDMAARLRFFADDLQAMGVSEEELGKVCGELKDINLPKLLRNRDHRISDIEFRNIFDDITLRYVRKQRESQ